MEIHDIIDAASSFVHPSKGTLVLHRSMRQHPKFKVYKTYYYHLYLIKGKEKKERILTWEQTVNSPADNMLSDWKRFDKEFLKQLIPWLTSNSYMDLRNGTE